MTGMVVRCKCMDNFIRNKTMEMLVLAILVSSCAVPVNAWGKIGHEIVGNVASAMLSEHALTNIEQILSISSTNHSHTTISTITPKTAYSNNYDCYEFCSPLAIVANWADHVRSYYHWSAPYHYIDVRDDLIVPNGCPVELLPSSFVLSKQQENEECAFHYDRDCPNNTCVAGAIMNYTQQLQDDVIQSFHPSWGTKQQYTTVQESLMFLVHFIGDIHQPLHCSRATDRGGNTIHVHYNDRQDNHIVHSLNDIKDNNMASRQRHLRSLTSYDYIHHHHSLNLHAVWDDSIIETIMEQDFHNSRHTFEASLISYIMDIRTNHPNIYYDQWLKCNNATNVQCVTQWGQESFRYAVQYAYSNVDGTEITNGATLTKDYYASRNPIVRIQLAKAAVRLASILEQILGAGDFDFVIER